VPVSSTPASPACVPCCTEDPFPKMGTTVCYSPFVNLSWRLARSQATVDCQRAEKKKRPEALEPDVLHAHAAAYAVPFTMDEMRGISRMLGPGQLGTDLAAAATRFQQNRKSRIATARCRCDSPTAIARKVSCGKAQPVRRTRAAPIPSQSSHVAPSTLSRSSCLLGAQARTFDCVRPITHALNYRLHTRGISVFWGFSCGTQFYRVRASSIQQT
jgi:hypothetical protein